jgi:hypothetical protein
MEGVENERGINGRSERRKSRVWKEWRKQESGKEGAEKKGDKNWEI